MTDQTSTDLLTVNEAAALLGVSRARLDYLTLTRRLVPVREKPRMFRRVDVETLTFHRKRTKSPNQSADVAPSADPP